MAHIRKDSSRPTTTVSWEEELLSMIEDFRFENRFDNRSQAINELVKLGFKYRKALERKKARQSALV